MNPVYYNTLQCRVKALEAQLEDFKSGKVYQQLCDLRRIDAKFYNRIISDLKSDLTKAHSETVNVRNGWFDVFEDMLKENDKQNDLWEHKLRKMEERALKAERQRDIEKDKVTEWRRKYYETAVQLEEERGRNQKLLAQLNRSFENSSIPSSKTRIPKKIQNSREKTGRKPGGQPGHEGHHRKKQVPTRTEVLPPPQEVLDDKDFKKTGKTITKQMVSLRILLETQELSAEIYHNSKTNEYIHAAFPEGFINEVNYDASIRAFLYLLNNDCNVSIDKCRNFLSDITGGRLNISKGMINGLAAEFAKKSERELEKAYGEILLAPVMHVDNTVGRVNGRTVFIHVCALPDGRAVYTFHPKKGHEGVKETLARDYQGTLVHDHDTTYYHYGSRHQECNAHILRYLKNSIENEPERSWSTDMHVLIREMIHYINSLPQGSVPDPVKVAELEQRYDAALEKARKEYEDQPPSEYFKDGYNLFRRMEKYKENHLLFLHDPRVPATNNGAERPLRNYKRKQTQAVSFRSEESVDSLCKGMTRLVLMRQNGDGNIFDQVVDVFKSD